MLDRSVLSITLIGLTLAHIFFCARRSPSVDFETVEVTRPLHAFYYTLTCSFCSPLIIGSGGMCSYHPCPLSFDMNVCTSPNSLMCSPNCNITWCEQVVAVQQFDTGYASTYNQFVVHKKGYTDKLFLVQYDTKYLT
jgi:hypothetical protein